jgi:lysophospholipase L1-like esterase
MTIENDLDWANLEKYKGANLELKKSNSGKDRIVFIGDSITEGWSNFSPEFFQQNNFVNRGIGGQTTPQMLIRLKPDAVHLDPKMIVINGGTNDIAGNTGPSTPEMIIDNICSMAEIAIKNNIDVALTTILPVYKYPGNDEVADPPKIISFINSALEEYCKKNSLIYVDYYSSMVDEKKGLKSEYGNDGVHPTKEGYEVMEKAIKNVIPGTV